MGRFHGTLFLSAKRHRSLVRWEDSIRKTLWRTLDQSFRLVHWYFWERPVKNPLVWKESLTWIVPRIRLYAGGIWKGDVLVADVEELETMDASEIYSKRLNAKEVIFPPKMENSFFQSQMDESKHLEEIRN